VSISSYSDLIARCQDWLFGRTDLAARVPDFITMFEAKANRNLLCRQMEARAVAAVDLTSVEPEFICLPPDFHSMRRVRLLGAPTTNGKPRLKFATGAQIDDLREKNVAPGVPLWFSIFGAEIELCPVPDNAYSVEMVYRTYLLPLGAVNATNWLLALAPDAYLYGTLMEAAPYLHEDDRIQVWSSGVSAAFDDLNKLSDEATFNAGPLTVRRKGRGYS
jgi:hypothetical protein